MLVQEKLSAEEFVRSRSWYQTIDFGGGLVSRGCAWCGEMAWRHMAQLLPDRFDGMRVLDLGCNAGLFCVKAALLGAREVVGVDWPGWRPGWDFAEQRVFVKEFFEEKAGRPLPITYHEEKMEEFLKRKDIGHFDFVFGIASLYYAEGQEEVVHNISLVGDNLLVRLREESIKERFDKIINYSGFRELGEIQERCWEEVGSPTDDFYLFLYTKDKGGDCFFLLKGHEDLVRSKGSVNIWQLLNLVGTEIPVERYVPRIPEKYLTHIPLGKLNTGCVRVEITDGMRRDYPWDRLLGSIKERGFLVPAIVQKIEGEHKIGYIVLEGKHRTTVLASEEGYDKNRLIPCLVVRHA